MYCNRTAVLNIDSVYKHTKNYQPQVYAEECKYTDTRNQQCSMLSDWDDVGYFQTIWHIEWLDDDGYFGKVVEDYKKLNEHIFEVVARSKRVK